jgi:hypothetical protein
MKKLSKDKRDKFILTCLLFFAASGVLYTFVLGAQKDQLFALDKQILIARDKLGKGERLVKSAPAIETTLKGSQKVLDSRQESMAPPGQYYYWFLKLMDQFREEEKLNPAFIIDITQPEFIEAGLVPNFPYKAASFGLRLNGQYQEIGRFVADLENNFPYFRVQNVRITPARTGFSGTVGPGKLTGSLDGTDNLVVELRVVTLIKGGTT